MAGLSHLIEVWEFLEVGSNDSAVEVSDGEVELHDLLQRMYEEESYNDLDSQPGKKGRINPNSTISLRKGGSKDVRFRTFNLKP